MSIWKEQKAAAPGSPATAPVATPAPTEQAVKTDTPLRVQPTATDDVSRRMAERGSPKESLIAGDLTIEGKIEGAGHVRIAGRFKGDVHVQGNLTIEVGAKVTGGVRANTVIIAGELDGNIDSAMRVELVETGLITGDVKAGSLTVAAGSRMRGNVEFGWEGKSAPAFAKESGTAA